jgi:uncharacterized membrane protein
MIKIHGKIFENFLKGWGMNFYFLILIFCFLIAKPAMAHDSSKHRKVADTTIRTFSNSDTTSAIVSVNEPPLDKFPTLHPLVVHFPIMLLFLAAVIQVFSFFIFKKELSWTSWAMLLFGFIGAYASSYWFHAHAAELPPLTQALLEEHELFAEYTVWFSGIALLVHSVNLFILKNNIWLKLFAAGLLIASAVFVAVAGHHGAELVHKHGVGAKGAMLEKDHH